VTPRALLDLPSIARHKGEPGEFTFDALRGEGIAHAQGFSGSIWTDYNEHDPGVTILEQVCYALTDILYRAGFSVADLLADETGGIDWEKQALLPPEEAFPSSPVTELDYRIHILNAVPEVENIEIQRVGGEDQPGTGLYRFRIRVRQNPAPAADDSHSAGEDNPQDVVERVHRAFSAARNLCEDLESIEVVPTIEYSLQANIVVRDGADPADVLARIYYACEEWLAAGIEFQSYERALSGGAGPEAVFRGPFSPHGVKAADHGTLPTDFPASDILPRIRRIPGVDSVTMPAQSIAAPEGKSARLHWPQSQNEILVKLFRNGRELRVWLDQLNMRFKELNMTGRDSTFRPGDIELILPRPKAEVRDVTRYESVQYQFPPIYGLGRNVLPASGDPLVKARIQQLRSYLLFFDQHMADYLAMLGNLRVLFSLDVDRRRTYSFQELTPASFPGINDAYRNYAVGHFKTLISSHHYSSRADRLIDYLLALYGEAFRDVALKSDAPGKNVDEEDAIFRARIDYLRHVAKITRDRGSARDYTRDPAAPHNRSGLETKLSHLLGFEQHQSENERVRVIEHLLLRPEGRPFRISVLFPDWPDRCRQPHFRSYAESLVDAACPAHIYADIYWLTANDLDKFDDLHDQWWRCYEKSEPIRLAAKPGAPDDREAADTGKTAGALIGFLKECEKKVPKGIA
jgi:hypothetical protein